jgi:isoquinoline 1-oxidoreductase subunit beta
MPINLSRRTVLAGAAAALTVPFAVKGAEAATAGALTPFLRIDAQGRITAVLPTSEMGQGTHTGQAMILADELGVPLSAIRIDMPTQPSAPYRLPFGQMRSVGSFGIRHWAAPMRRAAAQARTVLIEEAAARWKVAPDTCALDERGARHLATGRRIALGALVAGAAARPLPETPVLKTKDQRKLAGTSPRRVDTPSKINGSAVFGIDVRRPGMLHGAVRLSPVHGAELDAFKADSVMRMPGVAAVAAIPHGAVVVGETWWQAKQAADALDISWKPSPNVSISSADLSQRMREGLSAADALPVISLGDNAAALARGKAVEADYEVPFLTHISMEPIACTAELKSDRCDVWISTQGQDIVTWDLEKATGLSADKIFVHTTYLGGGFGRKTLGEIAVAAALASKAANGRPVKVVWAREDDIQQGQYRPCMTARMRASLTDQGQIDGLAVQISGPMMGRQYRHITIQNNRDPFSVSVLADHKYASPNYALSHKVVDVPPTLCPWRSVSSSQNGFFVESFIDELAHAAGADPIAFRKAHLQGQASHLAVLDAVAKRSGWGQKLPKGRARGVAVVESYGSRCAQVIEIEMVDGKPIVRRVVLALDCGEIIHPGQVEQQMMGSVIEGLSAALWGKVTLKDGRTEQANFHDYRFMRIDEVPPIEIVTVDVGSPIGGVGEPGVPPTAPALTNAIFAATGKRIRTLPVMDAFA